MPQTQPPTAPALLPAAPALASRHASRPGAVRHPRPLTSPVASTNQRAGWGRAEPVIYALRDATARQNQKRYGGSPRSRAALRFALPAQTRPAVLASRKSSGYSEGGWVVKWP